MMNKVILVGRLTRDPELRYTPSNVPTASFTIAVSRPFSNQQTGERDADFIPVVVWRKQAENVKKFTQKGSLVGVEGRIQTRTYDDNNGVRKYITEVIADNVVFLDTKNSDNSQQFGGSFEPQKKEQSNDEDDRYSNVMFTNENLPF